MSLLFGVAKTVLRWVSRLAVAWGALFLLLLAAVWALDSHFCPTEALATVSGVAGFDFEISETNCDVIAKEAWISVFASGHGDTRKTLLFEYVPAGKDPIASITSIAEHAVKISVPRISSERYRRYRWKQLAVTYDIGAIDYPEQQR